MPHGNARFSRKSRDRRRALLFETLVRRSRESRREWKEHFGCISCNVWIGADGKQIICLRLCSSTFKRAERSGAMVMVAPALSANLSFTRSNHLWHGTFALQSLSVIWQNSMKYTLQLVEPIFVFSRVVESKF